MEIKYNTMIVSDMEKSVKYYTENLGFKVEEVFNLGPNQIILLKSKGNTMLELIDNKDFDVGFYSIGMEVDDLDKTVKDLKDKGIEFLLEPVKITVGKMAKIKDPNGVIIVLLEHTK